MTEVRVTRRFNAPAEKVFDAWLNPELARRFAFATPNGEMIRYEIDPRVGGKFNFTDRRPDMGDVEHVGEYLEMDRPRRLVFTFGVPKFDPTFATVTIELTPTASGCELSLTQAGVPDAWKDEVPKGWTMILDGLAGVLSPRT
jgi:uncharacterized protein YndB with AHSA1/START domain